MKKYIFLSAICVIICQALNSQVNEPFLLLYKNGELIRALEISEIDSIKIETDNAKIEELLPYPSFSIENGFMSLEKDEMVLVKGGTFTMGATSEQSYDYKSDERPTHQVTLSDFYIGKYEVTQELWEYVMAYSGTCADGSKMSACPSGIWLDTEPNANAGGGNYYPAYYVSWEDIIYIFIPRLNKITGKTFRLPTEAEWEYAARGGNKSKGYKYSGSNAIDNVAWHEKNAYDVNNINSGVRQVGKKSPNELGLYDMSGNVYEWCSDWYGSYSSSTQTNPTGPTSGTSRVNRGGSWYSSVSYCRVASREENNPNYRSKYTGFRLVMQ